tara:strand:- start:132 stop:623 length:492 start_codon:yes stop_codon:yes gene_type:complete
MIEKNNVKRSELLTLCIIFLITLLISKINIPVINTSGHMPDYFLALFVCLIASRFMNMNIYILFLLGLIVDLLVGELMGQYGLIFITIYFINFLLSKYFLFKTSIMLALQHLTLTTIGLIIFLISSLSYELTININLFAVKWIVTCLVCLLYNKLIQLLSDKV